MAIQWPPEIPRSLERRLAPYTFYKEGVCIWYRNRMVHICGKKAATRDLANIPELWRVKRGEIDRAELLTGGSMLTVLAMSRFYEYLDYRVKTQQPEPLSEVTRNDYERTLTIFGQITAKEGGPMVAETPIADIGPAEFSAFAKLFEGKAPSTLARNVAYVRAFIQFCKDEGFITELPQWGRFLVKPGKQQHRDIRLNQRKSFTPAELRSLWFYARFEEKLWMALGLLGAFDNSDIAHLTLDVMDRKQGVFDYRRRKRGLIPRLIPIPADVWELLDLYERPVPADPEYADLFFLTPDGYPLGRVARTASGKVGTIDYVAMRWTRLMQRAGLRARPVSARDENGKVIRNLNGGRRIKFIGGSDRRGFRSLRTSFANLAPQGYRDEVELMMGHATGILLENYLEEYGIDGLRECNSAVWHNAFTVAEAPAEQTGEDSSKTTPSPESIVTSGSPVDRRAADRLNSGRSRLVARQRRR